MITISFSTLLIILTLAFISALITSAVIMRSGFNMGRMTVDKPTIKDKNFDPGDEEDYDIRTDPYEEALLSDEEIKERDNPSRVSTIL